MEDLLGFQSFFCHTEDGEWIECPTFSGNNPKFWLISIEEFMQRFNIPVEQWINFASHQICGDARKWVDLNDDPLSVWSWSDFRVDICWYFDKTEFVEEKESVHSMIAAPSLDQEFNIQDGKSNLLVMNGESVTSASSIHSYDNVPSYTVVPIRKTSGMVAKNMVIGHDQLELRSNQENICARYQQAHPHQLFDDILQRDMSSSLISFAFLFAGGLDSNALRIIDPGIPSIRNRFEFSSSNNVQMLDEISAVPGVSGGVVASWKFVLAMDSAAKDDLMVKGEVPIAWEFFDANINFLEFLFGECSLATCFLGELFVAVHRFVPAYLIGTTNSPSLHVIPDAVISHLQEVSFDILCTTSYFYRKYDWGLHEFFAAVRNFMIIKSLGAALMPCMSILQSWLASLGFASSVVPGKSKNLKTLRGSTCTLYDSSQPGVAVCSVSRVEIADILFKHTLYETPMQFIRSYLQHMTTHVSANVYYSGVLLVAFECVAALARRSFTGGLYTILVFTKVLSPICICKSIWGNVCSISHENVFDILMWKGRVQVGYFLVYGMVGFSL